MGTDTVEEPAVVTDDDRTTGKSLKSFLEGSQGIHVDIVGRFVKQQHISFLLQGDGQMQTISLTTREHTAFLLLIGSTEVETAQIGTHVDIASTQTDGLVALTHHLIDTLIGVDILMLLVNIREFHRLAHLKSACISLFQTHDETEEGGLTSTIGTNNAHNTVRRQVEVEVGEEHLVTVSLSYMRSLDDLIAQTGSVGDIDLEFLLLLFLFLVEHLIVGVQTCLTLCLTSLGSHTHPL